VPDETTIGVDFGYSTAVVEFPEGSAPEFKVLMTMPNAPDSSRMGLLILREDKYLFAALGGRGVNAPPADWPGFVKFAATLSTSTMHEALAAAKVQGKVVQFLFPESRRRHYDRLENWPRGLLPMADAVCRFNPVYGQGMTAAAKEAVLLRELLDSRHHDAQPLAGLTEALLAAINPLLDNIWALSAMPDLAYPDARGERPENLEQALEYQVAVHRAALVDAHIHKLLYEVIGLIKPAEALHAEDVVEKVKRLAAEFVPAQDSVQV
jgi:2-polyprenyl-6-methoxyphenol hydroxylase-like FAD-dependent oxidoreductase